MKPLAQLRRWSSVGLGTLSLTLPFVVLSVDTAAAPPKAASTADSEDPAAENGDEKAETKEEAWGRKHRNIKLNYINASWAKVLQDFAEATQTEVVADRVPSAKFSRWDMKFYNREEALAVLNTELKAHNYRLQIKGHYLVLNALHEFRQEYAPALLRGDRPQPLGVEDVRDTQPAAANTTGEAAPGQQRTAKNKPPQSNLFAKRRPSSRDRAIRQASAEEDQPPERGDDLSAEPQPPVVTTLRMSERNAVVVAKIMYKAFKGDAELIDDGPRGLQGFLVRKQLAAPSGRKGARPQAGGPTVKFSIGIDEKKNQLVVEATPEETKAVVKLIKALDVPRQGAQGSVQAVGTTKDADRLAAALRPELNRLVAETRKTARQTAMANARDDGDDGDEEEAPAEEQPATPRRSLPNRAGRPDVPQALQKSLKGEVRVESIPELGILVLIGNDDDVQAVMSVIQEIEKLSAATTPEVKVAFLRHVSSETLAALLTSVYERLGQARNSTVQQSQAISVFPVARPNAILIVASKSDLPSIYDLIDELDQPSDPHGEFRVFRLKYAIPRQIVENVEALYPPQQQAQGATGQQNQPQALGLVPRVRIVDDLRTNSVIVQARPRDMKEVALLIGELDVNDIESVQRIEIFRLEYGIAEEVSASVSAAIQAVMAPSRATTVQQQGAGQGGGGPAPGGGQGGAGAGGGQGSSELREVKSAILKFRDQAGPDGRELRSGILADIRMTPDFRTNSITVTAPEESMELVAALIKQLDRPPAAVAEIKIFKLKNSDATAMTTLLSTMFGIQRTGQAGQQGGAGAQAGAPGMLIADAEDTSSMLIPLRFSVDVRTNSITAVGGAAALNVVESILLTLDESDIRARKTEVFKLINVPAANVATAISQFLTTQRQVLTADPGLLSPFEQIEREVVVVPETVTNNLLISATERYFNDIKKVIQQLDRFPRQVLIQALFVEVNLDNIDEFGMEFGVQDSILFKRSPLTTAPQFITSSTLTPAGTVSGQTVISESATPGYLFNGQQLGNNTTPSINSSNIGTQIGTGFATALTNSTLGYPGLLLQAGSQNLNLLLRALSYRNRVDILSRPMIRTVDNQTANIQVGQYVPIVNGFNANATTGVNSPIVQQRQIGIILQVTPRITPDGLVVMEVVARKDQLATTGIPLVTSPTGTVTSPIINTQNALTTIAVPNGQTVVLGGMITKNDNVQERKVPMLGDIPLLGQAFRYDFKETTRTELIIFLTPRIIHNDEEAEMFKEIEMGRLNFIESQAELVHGPLHGVFASPNSHPDPHYGYPAPEADTVPAVPPAPTKGKGIMPPPPPDAGLPSGSADIPQIPQPMPRLEEDARNSKTGPPSDDDEDLDAAFIQANYRVPQSGSDAGGRPKPKKSAAKSSATTKDGSKSAGSSKKTKAQPAKAQSNDDDQPQRAPRVAPDDS